MPLELYCVDARRQRAKLTKSNLGEIDVAISEVSRVLYNNETRYDVEMRASVQKIDAVRNTIVTFYSADVHCNDEL